MPPFVQPPNSGRSPPGVAGKAPRSGSDRGSIWDMLQTFLMVVLFTGLIWWNANELVRSNRSFRIRLQASAAPGMAVRITSADEFNVTVSASRRLLDALTERLQAVGNVVEYHVSESEVSRDPVDRSSREILAQAPMFEGSSLTITEVTPPTLTMLVDKLDRVNMTVDPSFGAVEVQNPGVSPSQVTVTIPQRDLKQHSRRITLYLEPLLRRWRKDSPGETTFSLTTPVPLPPNATRVEPASVTVTGSVVQILATRTKGPVQVLPAVPSVVQRDYLVEPVSDNGFRTDLTIRGPHDDLNALSVEQIRAYVDVLTADVGLAGQPISRRIVVILPKGFELVGDPPEVSFRLVPKASVPPAAGGAG